jgi:hypothetical protein
VRITVTRGPAAVRSFNAAVRSVRAGLRGARGGSRPPTVPAVPSGGTPPPPQEPPAQPAQGQPPQPQTPAEAPPAEKPQSTRAAPRGPLSALAQRLRDQFLLALTSRGNGVKSKFTIDPDTGAAVDTTDLIAGESSNRIRISFDERNGRRVVSANGFGSRFQPEVEAALVAALRAAARALQAELSLFGFNTH